MRANKTASFGAKRGPKRNPGRRWARQKANWGQEELTEAGHKVELMGHAVTDPQIKSGGIESASSLPHPFGPHNGGPNPLTSTASSFHSDQPGPFNLRSFPKRFRSDLIPSLYCVTLHP